MLLCTAFFLLGVGAVLGQYNEYDSPLPPRPVIPGAFQVGGPPARRPSFRSQQPSARRIIGDGDLNGPPPSARGRRPAALRGGRERDREAQPPPPPPPPPTEPPQVYTTIPPRPVIEEIEENLPHQGLHQSLIEEQQTTLPPQVQQPAFRPAVFRPSPIADLEQPTRQQIGRARVALKRVGQAPRFFPPAFEQAQISRNTARPPLPDELVVQKLTRPSLLEQQQQQQQQQQQLSFQPQQQQQRVRPEKIRPLILEQAPVRPSRPVQPQEPQAVQRVRPQQQVRPQPQAPERVARPQRPIEQPRPAPPTQPRQQLYRQQQQFEADPQEKQYSKSNRARKPTAQVLRKYRDDNPDGSITWGFENDDGTFKEETIGVDCVTRGKYGYIDPDGVRREFSYSSGLPCDKTKDAESQASEGYIDYTNNRYVFANGDSVDLNAMVKNRARKPVYRN